MLSLKLGNRVGGSGPKGSGSLGEGLAVVDQGETVTLAYVSNSPSYETGILITGVVVHQLSVIDSNGVVVLLADSSQELVVNNS